MHTNVCCGWVILEGSQKFYLRDSLAGFFHVCLVQKTANTDLATLIFREEFMFGSKFAESLICNGFL